MNDAGDGALERLGQRPLTTRWLARALRCCESTGSTSDDVRAAAAEGAPHGFAVVADAQTSGRGRRGRSWHSPPGENLYASVLLRPPGAFESAFAPWIALCAGLAVREAVAREAPGRAVAVKWPNDVRVAGRKVAGALVEGVARAGAPTVFVLGVGVNCNGLALPEELASTATTLRREREGAPVARDAVFRALAAALERRLDALFAEGPDGARAELRSCCDTLGARVQVDGLEGVAVDVARDGALLVRDDGGAVRPARAGEVALLA